MNHQSDLSVRAFFLGPCHHQCSPLQFVAVRPRSHLLQNHFHQTSFLLCHSSIYRYCCSTVVKRFRNKTTLQPMAGNLCNLNKKFRVFHAIFSLSTPVQETDFAFICLIHLTKTSASVKKEISLRQPDFTRMTLVHHHLSRRHLWQLASPLRYYSNRLRDHQSSCTLV